MSVTALSTQLAKTAIRPLATAALLVPPPLHEPLLGFSKEHTYDVASKKDLGSVMDFVLNEVIPNNPLFKSLRIDKFNGFDVMEFTVRRALQERHSVVVRDRASEKVLGVRLLSTAEQFSEKPSASFNATEQDDGVRVLTDMLTNLQLAFWDSAPGEKKVLRRDLSHVRSKAGAAIFDLEFFGVDEALLRAKGYYGVTAVSSVPEDTLNLEASGYRQLCEFTRPNAAPLRLMYRKFEGPVAKEVEPFFL